MVGEGERSLLWHNFSRGNTRKMFWKHRQSVKPTLTLIELYRFLFFCISLFASSSGRPCWLIQLDFICPELPILQWSAGLDIKHGNFHTNLAAICASYATELPTKRPLTARGNMSKIPQLALHHSRVAFNLSTSILSQVKDSSRSSVLNQNWNCSWNLFQIRNFGQS